MCHDALVEELAATLRADVVLSHEADTVPTPGRWSSDRAHLLELTDWLLEKEDRDAVELRELAKDVRPVKDTTLWHLLVHMMELDAAKHIDMLELVRLQVRDADRALKR